LKYGIFAMKRKSFNLKITNALEDFLLGAGFFVPDGIFEGIFIFMRML